MKTLVVNQKCFVLIFVTLLIAFSTQSTSYGLNVGEPRTVRLLYFLPNDRPYRQEVVDAMKTGILEVQSFYAEQMAAHGFGNKTFRIETDDQGDPKVHRVDGGNIGQMFDLQANVYLIVNDSPITSASGSASRVGKNGGHATIFDGWNWFAASHELGHAFGLPHDFRDNAYILSYGRHNRSSAQLSACAAEFLAVHPYFNSEIPIEEGSPPTIELISSPEYAAGSNSITIQLKVSDSEGLHQVLLFGRTSFLLHRAYGARELITCRGLTGETDTIVEFDYDGVIPSSVSANLPIPIVHPIEVAAVDMAGNVSEVSFVLAEVPPQHIATLGEHTDWVNSVAFSPDGITLASGSGDGTVKLWNASTRDHIATLDGHTNIVRSVAFSPDGTTLASGSIDGKVKLWNVSTKENIATLSGHHAVASVAFSPDGTTLASGGTQTVGRIDNRVILWDVATRTNIATLEGHRSGVRSVAFSPDGTTLASLGSSYKLNLWDVATRTNIATIENMGSQSVSFSPDGMTLASPGAYISDPTAIKLWDVAAREQIATLENQWTNSGEIGHTDRVLSVAFSPDGTILASAAQDKTVQLWNVATKEHIAIFSGHTATVTSVAFSPDGTMLASVSGDNKVKLWDTSEWAGTPVVNHAPTGAVTISGTAAVGETLTADASTVMDPDGPETLQFSYQWLASDVMIAGATSRTYTLTENETGKTIRVRASYIDGLGRPVNITSKATEVVSAPLASISDRTPQVQDAIIAAIPGVNSANDVTAAHLAAITSLSIRGSDITRLRSGDFDGLTTLTTLRVGGTKLSSLPSGIFDNFIALTELYLGGNNDLNTLPSGIFDNLTALKKLYLNENGMPSLRSGVFDNNTVLEELGLGGNDLRSLPSGIFDNLTALKKLNMSYNELVSLRSGVFDNNIALTELHLYYNDLNSLPSDIFDNNIALTTLTIWRNNLSSLSAGIFDNNTALTNLSIGFNSFSSLPSGIFEKLTNLIGLGLLGNQFRSLPNGIFNGLSTLTSLNVSQNPVDPLPLPVSLEKVADGQFKAVAPAGAPFDIVVPLRVRNGEISGGATSLTITAGSTESEVLTVTRTPGTSGAASVGIGALPSLPANHTGYRLANATREFNRLIIFDDTSEQVWSGIITVGSWGNAFANGNATGFGYSRRDNAGSISNATFTYRGTTYTINGFGFAKVGNDPAHKFVLTISPGFPACDKKLLRFGGLQLADAGNGSAYGSHTYNWHGRWAIWAPIGDQWSYSLTLHPTMPDAPIVTASNEGNQVMLSWETPCDGGIDITRHEYRQRTRDGAFGSWIPIPNSGAGAVNVASYTLTVVNNPEEHIFEVRAVNELGEGAASPPVSSSDRTPQVAEAILEAVKLNDPNVSSYADITDPHLTAITTLNVRLLGIITTLKADDFEGLTSLEELNLWGSRNLTGLPDSIFEGLTSLTRLQIYPLFDSKPITVSLEKVADGQFKAIAPTGAPFSMELPLTVTNGSISGGATTITIPVGSVESEVLTVTRTPDTTGAVTVNIGTLPSLPSNHSGYTLVKSADLPLSYPLPEVPPLMENRTQQVQDAIIAAIPGVNSASDVTEAHLAAIRFLNLQRKNITALKTGDFDGLSSLITLNLTYNDLTTLPAGVFPNLSSLRSLLLYGNDLASLPAGIFDDLSSLTELNLYNNDLTSLPAGIFDNLLKLTRLSLGSNQLTTLSMGIFDELSSLTSLYLGDGQLATVPAGVFTGLSSLTELWLHGNQLTTLSVNAFSGLSSLTRLWLQNNSTNPLSVAVSLELVDEGRFKAIAPAGAPFDFVLQISVANGTITGGATTITIPKGSVESDTLTIIRIAGTTAAVTVDIGTLPGLPTNVDPRDRPLHQGYELVKSADLPLEVIGATAPQVTGINIPDANLRAKIESALGKTSGDPITAAEMATLTSLTAQDARITNVTGLETATNLTTLKFGNNTISNISALSGLTNLTELQLWDNQISNLSNLSGLTNLTTLFLWGNNISNISHLSGLTSLTQLRIGENSISNIAAVSSLRNLTYLSVKENAISDISAVSGLTNLTQLLIGNNTISDIAPVQNLTKLVWLDMPNNRISDISAVQNLTQLVELYFQNNAASDLSQLVANTGLGTDDELDVQGNPLSYPSIYTHIPALQARNVYIDFDNRVATAPVKISGDTQQSNTGATLTQPFIVEVRDGSSVVFAGVPVTFAVTAGGGTLSATNTTTDVNGRAETTLTLGNTAGTNTVRVSVQGISQTITFTATATATPVVKVSPIINRTPQVHSAIVSALSGVNSAADVTEAHLAAITELDLSEQGITTLQAGDFDGLTALATLNLRLNNLTELPLGIFDDLTAITSLDLGFNRFTTLPLGIFDNLTALTELTIDNGRLTALPSGIFDDLTALTSLNLLFNQFSTLPVGIFDRLTNLTELGLSGQRITLPAGVFDNLTLLTKLNLANNEFTTLPAGIFDRLTNLTELGLYSNRLTTLPAGIFDKLTNLTLLALNSNRLTTLPAGIFDKLTNLKWLFLSDNRFTTLPTGIFDNLTSLRDLRLFENRFITLPAGIFEGQTQLQILHLQGNAVVPLPLTISLKKVAEGQFKAVAPTGAPFNIVLPLSVTNGSISGGATTLTIPIGKVESAALTVTRTAGTTAAISVDIGDPLPGLPSNHAGYTLAKSDDLPLEIFTAPGNSAPVFTDGGSTTRSVAENTASGQNVGTALSATDVDSADRLTYTLSGTNASVFSIDSTTGQLKTKDALDYETKRLYNVTVTVSDGKLTNTISVSIAVTDVVELATAAEVCQVGDVLAPGESCTYPGTDTEFSVSDNGSGQFLFFNSGNRLSLRNTEINGKSYTLVAGKLASGSWEIEEIADGGTQQPDTREQSDEPGLTARFDAQPASHDGSRFTLELHLSEEIEISYKTVRDAVLDVTGGAVQGARRLKQGSNLGWQITIKPDSKAEVSIVLLPTTDCEAVGAVCTVDGRGLSNKLEVVVPGPEETEDPINVGGTPTLSLSTAAPLTEATLHESIVTLTLNGGTYDPSIFTIKRALTVSWIGGVTVGTSGGDRVSDTQVTVELRFDGNLDTDGMLTFSVGAGAITGYDGAALTAQIPVPAVSESIVASTAAPLTEATLDESIVTLTLNGRKYEGANSKVRGAMSVSGIQGVTVQSFDIDRVNDTEVSVELTFNGDLSTDGTLTLTVGVDAIAGYNGPALTAQVSVSASTEAPATGDKTTPVVDETTPVTDGTSPGVCKVGNVLAPGESCTYPGTDTEFSVNHNGLGQFLFFSSGNRLSIENSEINGESYTLVAEKLTSGSWEIKEIADSGAQQPDTPEQPEQPGDTRPQRSAPPPTVTPGETHTSAKVSFKDFLYKYDENAYQVQLRRKVPQGEWITKCAVVGNSVVGDPRSKLPVVGFFFFPGSSAGTFVINFSFTGLEPDTTYEARYRDTNLSECVENPPSPDPWSEIAEGTTLLVTPPRVEFADATLATAVREALHLDTAGEHIELLKVPQAKLASLTEFDYSREEVGDRYKYFRGEKIVNLTGLEHATRLMKLRLGGNEISDITPLAQLTQLTTLDLGDDKTDDSSSLFEGTVNDPGGNQIRDITPLAQLTRLTTLDLGRNEIINIAPLAKLTKIEELYLQRNQIADIASLQGLTNLRILNLYGNRISDVSILTGLVNLQSLNLIENPVKDQQPLLTLLKQNPNVKIYLEEDSKPLSLTPGETPTLTVSTAAPLTEATLHAAIVTFILSSGTYEPSGFTIKNTITVSGITGVAIDTFGVERVSDTQVTVKLEFDGTLDTDGTLTFSVGAGAVAHYDGAAFTAQIPVTAVTESIVASTAAPLTEATLDESIVTLTLSGRNFEVSNSKIRRAMSVSGIQGVTVRSFDIHRVSDTEVSVELTFDGDLSTDGTLTFTVGTDAIAGYNAPALTAQVSVSASIEAPDDEDESTPVTDKTTPAIGETSPGVCQVGNVLAPGESCTYPGTDTEFSVSDNGSGQFLFFTGGDRLSLKNTEINGESYTLVAKKLASGSWEIEEIADSAAQKPDAPEQSEQPGDKGPPQQPVKTGGTPTLTASTTSPLTEAALHGSIVTLTLSGGTYARSIRDIKNAVSVSGITGVTIPRTQPKRKSDTQITIELGFNGNLNADSTLTFTVGAGAIVDYTGPAPTKGIRVTANTESVVASSAAPLTEETLHESVVTLTLSGATYEKSSFKIRGEVGVIGINGVTVATFGVERISDTQATIELEFDGTDFDTTSSLTFTVEAEALAGYNGPALTTQLSVTALTESVAATTPVPLTEATLDESVVTLTLNGRKYEQSGFRIKGALSVSGIQGVTIGTFGVNRVNDTQITVELAFNGNFDTDSTLTFTVGKEAIADYTGPALTAQLPVTADREDALLVNFPNPFNPETWIPYQLAKPAEVTITIYAVSGHVVRQLVLGHQAAGIYRNRSRAAYWDGKNEFSEPVASGLYFYTLTAGNFTATRKMLIQK